jgi:hypothetical protein
MSDFAAYATFFRNKLSKQAEWQDDLLNTIKAAPPELVGAGIGGLGGAATGLFSGNMLRNGLIGAGLGAGAGFGYRMMGNKQQPELSGPPKSLMTPEMAGPPKPLELAGPPKELANNPVGDIGATPIPSTSEVAAPGKSDGKSLGETVGPLKQLGLPAVDGPAKAPSQLQVNQQQGAASVAARDQATAKMQALLKGTPLEGKDPNNLSVVDQLTLSPTRKKILAVLQSRQPSGVPEGPGTFGKAVAGVGDSLIAAGEGVDEATAKVKDTAAAGAQKVKDTAGAAVQKGKDVIAAPGKYMDERKAKADAEAKKEQDLLKQLEELSR